MQVGISKGYCDHAMTIKKLLRIEYFFDLGAIVNLTLLCYSCPSSYITRAREFLRLDILV